MVIRVKLILGRYAMGVVADYAADDDGVRSLAKHGYKVVLVDHGSRDWAMVVIGRDVARQALDYMIKDLDVRVERILPPQALRPPVARDIQAALGPLIDPETL